MNTLLLKFGRALLFAALSVSAGSALATATFGTRADNYCAARPTQATAPQQSRPYRAASFSCFLCHTGSPSANNLNAFGNASLSCTSTTCGAAMNPFCVATPPSNASITAPAAGTTVAQGQSLTYTAGNATNPDGFPLSFTWLFTGGMPNATGQSVSVPMTVAGAITSTLQVRNSVGMLATGTPPTRSVTVTGAANQPPVATINAPAANVTVAQGGTVNFQGSGTDPDNNLPLTYNWNFGGGAPNSTAQNPGAVTFNTAGTFTVSFTVTDSLGLSSTAITRTVTVTSPANQPPVATITAPAANATVAQGGTVTFQGSGTDPNNNLPLTYNWNFGGGAPNSTAQNPGAVTFNTAGTFTVSFTVTDSLGLSSAAVTRTVTVTPPANQPPVATINAPAANVTVAQGGTVNFQGSGTDPNNNLPLTYNWNFGGGAPNSTQQNPGAVMFNTAGAFTVTFTVTDSLGLASTPVTRVVTVTGAGQQPVAIIEEPKQDRAIVQGRPVEFHGRAQGGDDGLSFNWSIPGGTPASSTRNEVKVIFNAAGTFTASLTVTNRQGVASAPAMRAITVTPSPNAPVAIINAPAANVTITQGGTVNFQGSGTDPDNRLPLTYNWNFGGGAPNSTQQNPGMVMFNTVGTFTVTFTVTDNRGLVSASVTRVVTVTPVNQAPTATINAPADNVTIAQGGTVNFQGSGVDPDNNLPLTFNWDFGGGAPNSTQQNPGAVTFNTAGAFTVTFTVTDSLGLSSAAVTRTITVTATPQPAVTIVAPAMNVSVLPGGTVTFRGAATGEANERLRYRWSFQGGSPDDSTRQNPGAVRFREVGTHTVTLTVTGRGGRSLGTATRVVTVAPPNQRPRLNDDCRNGDDDD
ncbi:PKD domain-containing protein [Candidatus Ferrigenium straubiae]|jgi:PKD repeat protein|uniref:PKD domain-containing protein n=1 Tax=Candidatus Ferrigenium straubiae TaxID=2919506 RepID=UPI003F4A871D